MTAELRRRLEAGEYLPGSDLPPSAALAAELGVSAALGRSAKP